MILQTTPETVNLIYHVFDKLLPLRHYRDPLFVVFALTSVRRVGRRAVEESGRASEVGHARVVAVAVHGAADGRVTGLLRRGAGHITVRGHATAAAHKPCKHRKKSRSGRGTMVAMEKTDNPRREAYPDWLVRVLRRSQTAAR